MLLLLWGGAGHFHGITDTDILQKPIDCILAGDQHYKERVTEWMIPKPDTKTTVSTSRSGIKKLGGEKPSYTVKSGPLNKSH